MERLSNISDKSPALEEWTQDSSEAHENHFDVLYTDQTTKPTRYSSPDPTDKITDPPYRGAIEQINHAGLSGWCIDVRNSNAPVQLYISFNGIIVGRTKTNGQREDIQKLVEGPCSPAYRARWAACQIEAQFIELVRPIVEADPNSLANIEVWTVDPTGGVLLPTPNSVEVTNSQIFEILKKQCDIRSATPISLKVNEYNESKKNRESDISGQIDGYLDGINGRKVQGWARNVHNPNPIAVALYIDDNLVDKVLASEQRDDLERQRLGSHAYTLTIPVSYCDGQTHRITVKGENDEVGILGSPTLHRLTRVKSAKWSIEHSQIRGWIETTEPCSLDIEVRSDGTLVDKSHVEIDETLLSQFNQLLPKNLHDGKPHLIQVSISSEPNNYFQSDNSNNALTFKRNVRYSIDSVDEHAISGWAFDNANPTEPIPIQLRNGSVIETTEATNILRQDVNKKYNISGSHGFSIPIPKKFYCGLSHQLQLYALDERLTLNPNNTLKNPLTPDMLTGKLGSFQGKVETITCQTLAGWAADRQDPERPVRVAVIVDGVSVAVVTANQFEHRLKSPTRSGFHAFYYKFPVTLMNSRQRRIEVRIVGTNHALPISQSNKTSAQVFFPLIDFFALNDKAETRTEHTSKTQQLNKSIYQAPSVNTKRKNQHHSYEILTSIIVLNWNGSEILDALLTSIHKHVHCDKVEIIIVDHGSTDNSLQVIEKHQAGMKIHTERRNANFSFASSNNLAAKKARGEYILFVNNDIVFTSDHVTQMIGWIKSDPKVGIVGIRLVEPLPNDDGSWRYVTHHRGVEFAPRIGQTGETSYHPVEVVDEIAEIGVAFNVPAVTGAALLCRKSDYLSLGGFDENYFYGLEDIDFCLKLTERTGKTILCDTSTAAIHNRSYTRSGRIGADAENPVISQPDKQKANFIYFQHQFKNKIAKVILNTLISGDTVWRSNPLRVTFVVTDASMTTPAGDFFTAMELGDAIRKLYGWKVLFAKRDIEEFPDTDVIIVMRHDFDLSKVKNANPGLITIAWVRNRVDQWIETSNFQRYNVILCSSRKSMREIRHKTNRISHLFPIATNPKRFKPLKQDDMRRSEIVFTGNYWGDDREAIDCLATDNMPGTLAIYGEGWEKNERWIKNWKGAVPYTDLPKIYSSADIVLDDSHPVTRTWNSVNSRVFDALAAGTLVTTNCKGGVKELFSGAIPTFSSGEEATNILTYYMKNPTERKELSKNLRMEVLKKHTYEHRARKMQGILKKFAKNVLRVAIKVPIPNEASKTTWGDWNFAKGIRSALEKCGHFARIDILPEWYTPLSVSDDIVLVLRGLSLYRPDPSKVNLVWLMSHPDDVAPAELEKYDHIFVASKPYTDVLKRRFEERVTTLLQCTDPTVFYPQKGDARYIPDIIFVGNSRGQRRRIVMDALEANLEFGIYGANWEGLVPPDKIHSVNIPNKKVKYYYSNAKIVLNDHWEDMKREGFISNRIFDAGACAATIISDRAEGIQETLNGNIITYETAYELRRVVDELLADETRRGVLGANIKRLVNERHTFDHRVATILTRIEEILKLKTDERQSQ